MRSLRTFACALLFFVIPMHAQAPNVRWFEASSGNFRLFTDTSEVKAQRLLADLELRLVAFQSALGPVPKRQFPIEVFLFKHTEDFVSSAPSGSGVDMYSNAFFVTGPDRMFVVAQDKSPEDIANDIGHTLGHVFLNRAVMWHPFWLEEGAGELFRKAGRGPDGKRVPPEDRNEVADLLRIVPSATYKDSDPAGPFRIQSYRLLRLVLEENAAALRAYVNALKTEAGSDAKLAIKEDAMTERLNQYTETRFPMGTGTPEIQVREVPADRMSIHRGDLLVASRQTLAAGNWYEGNSDEARAARAVLGKIVGGTESIPILERVARDFPDRGLVQFHFGNIASSDGAVVELQVQALRRAVQLLPLMGRAHAELARVLTITGRAEEALPSLDRAVSLEPEFADRFYLLRAESLLALRRYDESSRIAKFAGTLPHADRVSAAQFDQGVALVDKKIQEIRDSAERVQVDELRSSIQQEAARREPPKPPPPPPSATRVGLIDYKYEATTAIEILKPAFPDYPEALVKSGKSGSISLQVNIGVDGHVTSAGITDTQFPEMNAATIAAAKDWIFKPVIRNGQPAGVVIKLTFQYSIQ